MKRTRTRLSAVALVAASTAAACGVTGTGTETDSRPSAASAEEIEAIYRARTDSAQMRFTDADVHFMTGMIAHHAQAVVMGGLAPRNGAGHEVRTLAARIVNAQHDEIETMQRWLRERGQPVPQVHIEGTELTIEGPGHEMDMPGILSPEQMRELAGARGTDFDRLFLTYMIEHHRGAVVMVHNLFDTDGAAQDEAAFRLASDIQVDQRTEIARMERMLEELTADEEDDGGGDADDDDSM